MKVYNTWLLGLPYTDRCPRHKYCLLIARWQRIVMVNENLIYFFDGREK
jgi:hypothetical protein